MQFILKQGVVFVFRTNESYSRWLEARKAWSGILIRARDLVRMVRLCHPEYVLSPAHVKLPIRCHHTSIHLMRWMC